VAADRGGMGVELTGCCDAGSSLKIGRWEGSTIISRSPRKEKAAANFQRFFHALIEVPVTVAAFLQHHGIDGGLSQSIADPDVGQVIDLPEEHHAVRDQVDLRGDVRQRKQDNELCMPMRPAILQ
jgi:hypothetical protein